MQEEKIPQDGNLEDAPRGSGQMSYFSNPPQPEGMVFQLADGSIQACNSDTEAILGLKAEQMQGWTSIDPRWQVIHEDGSPFPGETHPAMVALRTGQPCLDVVMGFYKPSGELIWLLVNSKPLFQANDTQPYGVATTFRDISELKNQENELTEERLRLANERFELATAAINGLIYEWDLKSDRVSRTGAFEAITGYTLEESEPTGKWWQNLVAPEDLQELNPSQAWASFTKNGRYRSEYRIRHKDGRYIWVEDRGIAVKDDAGNILKIVGSTIDISDRKKAQIELQESEQRLKLAQRAANAGCWDWDMVLDRATYSDEYRDLFGLEPDALASFQHWLDTIIEADRERVARQAREAIEQHREAKIEFRIQHPVKGLRWLYAIGNTFYNNEGQPVRTIGITIDITERKQAELELRQSQECLQRMVDNAPIGIGIGNSKGEVLEINDTLLRMYGYTRQEYEREGINWQDFSLPEYAEQDVRAIAELERSGVVGLKEKEIGRKDNTRLPISICATRWKDDSDEHVAFLIDLSALKQTEKALQESEERQRLSLQGAGQGIWDWNLKTEVLIWDERCKEIFGLPPEFPINYECHLNALHPDDRQRVADAATVALQNRQEFKEEYRTFHPDGTMRWVLACGCGYYNETGEPYRMSGTVMDITERKQAEIALHEANQRILTTWESMTDAYVTLDDQWQIIYANQAAIQVIQQLTDLEPQQFFGKSHWEIFPSLVGREIEREYRRAVSERVAIHLEVFYEPTENWFEVHAYPSSEGLGIYFRDISDRKQAEEKLQEKEQQLRLALEAADMVAYSWDINSDLVMQTQNADRVMGLPLGTTVQTGAEFLSLIHPEDRERVIKALDNASKGTQDYREEFRLVCPDGNVRWLADRGWMSFDSSGTKALCLRGVIFDITTRKESEIALQENMAILNAINNATSTLIFVKDISGRIVVANPATIDLIGKPEAEIIGHTDLDYLSDRKQAEQVMSNDRQVMSTGQMEVFEEIVERPSGKRIFLSTKSPYRDKAGNIIGLIGISTDITKRKQTQRKLVEQAQLLDLTYEGIFVRDLDGSITYWNRGAEQMYGWTASEAIGQVSQILLQTQSTVAAAKGSSEEVQPDFSEIEQSTILLQAGHWEGELIHTCRDGKPITIDSRQVLMRDKQGNPNGILEVNRDISERKKIETTLRYSEERLRSFFEANIIGVVYGDVYGNIKQANDEFLRIIGYSREFVQSDRLDWIEITPPEYFSLEQEKVAEARITGASTPYEKEYIRADGSRVPVLIGYSLLGEAKEESVAFILDLSERKKVEAERAELLEREQAAREEAEKANRIKDEFLAILSHELRSPLNPILGWTQILQASPFDADKIDRGITTIERNAKLLNQLIDDLLDVNRILRGKLTLNFVPVHLAFTIEAAIETVRHAAIAKSISIETNLLPIGRVSGDSARLQQIVWNLLSNSVKFTPNGGRIEIELYSIGDRAKIRVSDTGKGIAPEFLPYVFEHFRQADASVTRNHGGLGLGLAIVRYLVELHQGEITVDSSGVDRGATFTVTLPLLDTQLESNERDNLPDREPELTNVRVLVVDDDPDTRDFLTIGLQQYQAQVVAVSSALEVSSALRTFQPNILVSDIGMPGIDGYTLLRSIRSLPARQGGQIAAIALTAYAREEDRQQALSAGFQVHLAKPIDPRLLAETIFLLLN